MFVCVLIGFVFVVVVVVASSAVDDDDDYVVVAVVVVILATRAKNSRLREASARINLRTIGKAEARLSAPLAGPVRSSG